MNDRYKLVEYKELTEFVAEANALAAEWDVHSWNFERDRVFQTIALYERRGL